MTPFTFLNVFSVGKLASVIFNFLLHLRAKSTSLAALSGGMEAEEPAQPQCLEGDTQLFHPTGKNTAGTSLACLILLKISSVPLLIS